MAPPDAIAMLPRRLPPLVASMLVAARRLGLALKPEDLGIEAAGPAEGPPLAEVLRRAGRFGLVCRARRLAWRDLAGRRFERPMIVAFRDGTSMVVARVDIVEGSPFVILEDPHAGRDAALVLDRRRFEEAWTGETIEVRRTYREVDGTVPFDYGLIGKLFFRERRLLVQLVVTVAALSLLGLVPILFLRIATTRVVQYRAIDTLTVLSAIVVGLIAIETGLGAARRYVAARLMMKVDVRLATLVFNRVLRLQIEHFETVAAGDTIYRMRMVDRLRAGLLSKALDLLLDAGILLLFIPVLIMLSPVLTAIILVLFAATVGWTVMLMPRLRVVNSAAERADSLKGFFLYQTIAGIRTIKSLALDARQRHGFADLATTAAGLRLEEGKVTTLMTTGAIVLQRLLLIGTMATGALLALQGEEVVSLGTLFAFIMLTQRVGAPLHNLIELIQQNDEANLAVGFLKSLLNQPEEEGRSGNGLRTPLRGHIAFANLRFKYRGAASPALRSISFEVPAGMTLGIMGRSGSGKTTITRLLQRLHADYQGLISVDGIDVRDYDMDHLRSSLGVVLQENFLFSGTIRENIMAAKGDATFDEVVHAARLAGAEEFIDKLPRGYDTVIYEGSPNLSGGQRQRLAIARALITDPRVLILDEATSALDAESEAIVNANLRHIAKGRTMLVISHRLSSLVSSDAIMVLDQGEVHDIGKHHELLERCDIYSGLWYHQNPHDEAAPPPAAPARSAPPVAAGA